MGFLKRIKYIYYPELRSVFASSLKVALGLCFKSGIAAEVIGYPLNSVGEAMYLSKLSFDMAEMLSYTVVIVLISVLCEKAITLILRRGKI
jgi:NitT/TauT family transport system permease protein